MIFLIYEVAWNTTSIGWKLVRFLRRSTYVLHHLGQKINELPFTLQEKKHLNTTVSLKLYWLECSMITVYLRLENRAERHLGISRLFPGLWCNSVLTCRMTVLKHSDNEWMKALTSSEKKITVFKLLIRMLTWLSLPCYFMVLDCMPHRTVSFNCF